MKIKGTKSEKNILAAFAGESEARNKYTYYAIQARKEGHNDIADFFEKMADNEREHAKVWFKLLHDGLGDTDSNLKNAAQGENYEWKTMYPGFAKDARDEGLDTLAMMFEKVAAIENDHEKRFLETYLKFKSSASGTPVPAPTAVAEKKIGYRCLFCGNIVPTRPDVCDVCEAIGAFETIG